jgi:pantothenate kinase type III
MKRELDLLTMQARKTGIFTLSNAMIDELMKSKKENLKYEDVAKMILSAQKTALKKVKEVV